MERPASTGAVVRASRGLAVDGDDLGVGVTHGFDTLGEASLEGFRGDCVHDPPLFAERTVAPMWRRVLGVRGFVGSAIRVHNRVSDPDNGPGWKLAPRIQPPEARRRRFSGEGLHPPDQIGPAVIGEAVA